jgi:hypothetical protein
MWLIQSTAVTVKLGPFVDDTNGNAVEDGLTIQKADVRLSKNGGNMAAASADQGVADAGAPHDELGYYDVSLDATDTDTLGRLKVMVHESGALPVWQDFMVVPANVWDSLFGADRLVVDVEEIGASIAQEIADALLNRDMSAGADTNARSPRNALRFLRNKWTVAAGTLTVTKEDDTTSAWTAAVSSDPLADPIIGSDPT